jgi:hypothetical protein
MIHEVFFAQSNSFLVIILDSVQFLCFQAHILLGLRLETQLDSTTVLYSVASSVFFYNPSARVTQKTQPELLTRRVYGAVA